MHRKRYAEWSTECVFAIFLADRTTWHALKIESRAGEATNASRKMSMKAKKLAQQSAKKLLERRILGLYATKIVRIVPEKVNYHGNDQDHPRLLVSHQRHRPRWYVVGMSTLQLKLCNSCCNVFICHD